ncbi:membrane protein PM19L [Silene latifolia]|uniref:membrane protein PM19L n=1 Tax=Silene latifolia TaxID=37657 RepID=UPI003D770C0C
MASQGPKSAAMLLLVVNLALYFIIMVISGWAVNHAIENTHESASVLTIPARIFPIYFPIGNMATGFFIIFSLLVGVLGMAVSLLGMYNVMQWSASSLYAASTSSLGIWALTVLAMGLACKEISVGYTGSNLRTLEVITIIVSGTQLICTGAIHVSADSVAANARRMLGGRV